MSLILVVARPRPDADTGGALAALVGALRVEVDRVRRAPPGALAHGTLDELAQAIGPDDVSDASVAYASDPAGAVAAVERAIAAGNDEVAVLPVAVAVEDGTTPSPTLDSLAELRARIGEACIRHADAHVMLVGAGPGEAPDIAQVMAILRPEGSDEPALLAGAVERAFEGDPARFGRFMAALQEGMPEGTRIALRGSAVQGHSYTSGEPFDGRGPATSDLDIVLFGDAAMAAWHPDAFYLPGVNTVPLTDDSRWVAPTLDPPRTAAQDIAGRPVNIQAMARWFLDLRSGLQGTPYVLLDA